MREINTDNKALKKFGITMGVIFMAVTLLILFKDKSVPVITALISTLFFIMALSFSGLLKPIYILWMKFSFILGWINTRLILFLIFYLVLTPIGLVMKLCGVDLLGRKIYKTRYSYWEKTENKEPVRDRYERQF